MNEKLRKFCIFIFFIPVLVFSQERGGYLDSLFVQNDTLHFSFHEVGTLDESILNGIRRGTTVAIEYQVQLWEKKSLLNDRLMAEKRLRMKVQYDRWEQAYVLTKYKMAPELMDEKQLLETCSTIDAFGLWPENLMKPDKSYMLVLRYILQPMSMENLSEIQQWLGGEMDELNPKSLQKTKSIGKRTGDWLLRLFVNLTGFGDRVIQIKSQRFTIIDNQLQYVSKEDE